VVVAAREVQAVAVARLHVQAVAVVPQDPAAGRAPAALRGAVAAVD
jgi:hypothetical protein